MKRMTVENWDDVADLCDEGAVQAEMADSASHTPAASEKARQWMDKLSMIAHKKARQLEATQKIKNDHHH